MAPRRNPDIVVAVLWEHGGWGAGSAHVAAQIIEAFVDKQRRLNHNLIADVPKQVEVGAVWSDPENPDGTKAAGTGEKGETASLHGGHFTVQVPAAEAKPAAQSVAVQ